MTHPQAAVAADYIDDDPETDTSEMDSFDFKTTAPVSYTGSNTVVRTVLDCAEHSGTKAIGVIKLYNTSKKAAESIMAEKRFRPGSETGKDLRRDGNMISLLKSQGC